MIDPTEIRPGNWVIKITGTDMKAHSFFEYRQVAPDEYFYTFAKRCFPIEISAHTLERSGFSQKAGDWHISLSATGLSEAPYLRFAAASKTWYFQKEALWSQPVYLHQLQNLYHALSNGELPVRLGRFLNVDMLEPIDFFVKPGTQSQPSMQLL